MFISNSYNPTAYFAFRNWSFIKCIWLFTLKKNNIDKLVNNQVIETIMQFGSDMRNVTEGFGKFDIFNINNNVSNLNEAEIKCIIHYLTNNGIYNMLFEDWSGKYIILSLSNQVYNLYKQTIQKYLTNDEFDTIGNILNISHFECLNFLTNLSYSITYHHNKSHAILQYIVNKFNNTVLNVLINQVYLATDNQKNSTNDFLKTLKTLVENIKNKEGEFICNAHEYIKIL